MKTYSLATTVVLASISGSSAFVLPAQSTHASTVATGEASPTALFEYIPSGFTKETWKKFQEKEVAKKKVSASLRNDVTRWVSLPTVSVDNPIWISLNSPFFSHLYSLLGAELRPARSERIPEPLVPELSGGPGKG